MTRAVLDEAARPLCRGIEALAQRAMAAAGITSDGVHALLLAGGGARMAALTLTLTLPLTLTLTLTPTLPLTLP